MFLLLSSSFLEILLKLLILQLKQDLVRTKQLVMFNLVQLSAKLTI